MVFSSLTFLFLYLPIVILLYFSNSNITYRNVILLSCSILFYAWGEPIYVALMGMSICINYYHAISIGRYRSENSENKVKAVLVLNVIINIGILTFFKYSDFLISNANYFLGLNVSFLELSLPIGISFYTFQTMSYVIDVYSNRVKVQRNILHLATYVTMFPQLIAGPIVRYSTIENQLINRTSTWSDISEGIRRFIVGLAKKVIIANQMAVVADTIFALDPSSIGFTFAWVGIIAYSFQIYFDFSGYSDMAIGLGKIFGFDFLENFNYPYISKSITEFWSRWHISLSTWFRDYVYIPLGGNRVGKLRHIINIVAVWSLTGLWHGAAWNFVIWGLYFSVILIFEKIILAKLLVKLPTILRHSYAILLIIAGWVIFRSDSLTQTKDYFMALIGLTGNNSLIDFQLLSLIQYFPYGIGAAIISTPIVKKISEKINPNIVFFLFWDLYLIFIFSVSILFLVNDTFNPFIYYRF